MAISLTLCSGFNGGQAAAGNNYGLQRLLWNRPKFTLFLLPPPPRRNACYCFQMLSGIWSPCFLVFAKFVVIFGIKPRVIFRNCFTQFHDPLGQWNLRQFWNIRTWYLCRMLRKIMILSVYTTTHKRFVIFTRRYCKLSWNTTALSQSKCRNFSCSTIRGQTDYILKH